MTALVEEWVPLSIAMNAMNRAMGQADFYPFVIAPRVVEKLGFVHALREGRATAPGDTERAQAAAAEAVAEAGLDADPTAPDHAAAPA